MGASTNDSWLMGLWLFYEKCKCYNSQVQKVKKIIAYNVDDKIWNLGNGGSDYGWFCRQCYTTRIRPHAVWDFWLPHAGGKKWKYQQPAPACGSLSLATFSSDFERRMVKPLGTRVACTTDVVEAEVLYTKFSRTYHWPLLLVYKEIEASSKAYSINEHAWYTRLWLKPVFYALYMISVGIYGFRLK